MDSLLQATKPATPGATLKLPAGGTATPAGAAGATGASTAAPAFASPPSGSPQAAGPDAPEVVLDANGTIPLDRVVAVVGDEPVLWSTVLERINVARAQGVLQIPSDSAGQMGVARKVTNDLIDEELLVQKAKELKVEVSDEDVAPAVEDQLKRVREAYPSAVEFRAALKQAGYGTPEEYRKALMDQQKRSTLERKVIEKLKQDGKLLPVGVTEADVDTAFAANRAQLPKRPATVTFRQIVIPPHPSPRPKRSPRRRPIRSTPS